jgi:hypothetical protein
MVSKTGSSSNTSSGGYSNCSGCYSGCYNSQMIWSNTASAPYNGYSKEWLEHMKNEKLLKERSAKIKSILNNE